jgi:hypothetical protein
MGALLGTQSPQSPTARWRKRARPAAEPYQNEGPRKMKTGLFQGTECSNDWCRGDDVGIIAGPTPLLGGGSIPPCELTYFARVIDPAYCPHPQAASLLVVQRYQRVHELVQGVGPEGPNEQVELIECTDRTLVQECAIVQRIHVACKPGTGARFFSSRSTRSFAVPQVSEVPTEGVRAMPTEGVRAMSAEGVRAEPESIISN